LSATALDYRSSEFDNGFLAPPCRTHAGGVGNKNYLYIWYTHIQYTHTRVSTRTCVCARHTMRTDLNVVRDGWPSLPPPSLPYPLLPRTDYHYIILIFTDCRVCGQKNEGSPTHPYSHTTPVIGDERRKFDQNILYTIYINIYVSTWIIWFFNI